MVYLFGFSGPASSGKSTLVTEVAEWLKCNGYNVVIKNEKFREVFNKHLNKYNISLDDVRQNPDLYLEIEIESLKEQFTNEVNTLYSQADIALFDRISVDYLMYSVFYLPVSKWMRMVKIYNELIKESLRLFDGIFLCEPLNNGNWNDGFRSENDIKNSWFHFELLRNWLTREESVKKLIIVKSDSIESRVRFVVGEIVKVLIKNKK